MKEKPQDEQTVGSNGKSVKNNCKVLTFMGDNRPVYTKYHPFTKNY